MYCVYNFSRTETRFCGLSDIKQYTTHVYTNWNWINLAIQYRRHAPYTIFIEFCQKPCRWVVLSVSLFLSNLGQILQSKWPRSIGDTPWPQNAPPHQIITSNYLGLTYMQLELKPEVKWQLPRNSCWHTAASDVYILRKVGFWAIPEMYRAEGEPFFLG